MNIDIIMPVFNTRPDYLLEAVYSILDQTHQDFRLLIVDDGSDSPATQSALNLAANLSSKIEVHTITHSGTPTAINKGHELAKTKFVAIMGSDDISHKDRLEKQLKYLKDNPRVDVLGTALISYKTFDAFRNPTVKIIRPAVVENTKETFIVCHGTAIYRLKKAIEIGGYNPTLLRAQDINFFLRMKAAGAIIHNLPDVLYHWRRYV